MTSFVQVDYQSGAQRAESMNAGMVKLRRGFDSTKGLSAMLLAAMVAALVLVADQFVDRLTDGDLLAGWLMLWGVGFAALAMLAGTAKKIAASLAVRLDGWSQRLARSRAEARLWEVAQHDPRVMAELQAARTRQAG